MKLSKELILAIELHQEIADCELYALIRAEAEKMEQQAKLRGKAEYLKKIIEKFAIQPHKIAHIKFNHDPANRLTMPSDRENTHTGEEQQ